MTGRSDVTPLAVRLPLGSAAPPLAANPSGRRLVTPSPKAPPLDNQMRRRARPKNGRDARMAILSARLEMGLRFCNRCGVDVVPIRRDMCGWCDKAPLTEAKGIG